MDEIDGLTANQQKVDVCAIEAEVITKSMSVGGA